MSEEETEVGQVTENSVPTETDTPATSGEKALGDADPRLNGKSAAELAEIIRNQDKQIGKFGNEIGKVRDLEQRIAFLTDFVQQRESQVRQPEPQQAPPQFDITDPDGWLRKNIGIEMQKYDAYQRQQQQAREMEEAQANFAEGKRAFFSDPRYKHLYDGKEDDISRAMVDAFQRKTFTKNNLRSVDNWVAAAQVVAITTGDTQRLFQKQGMPASVVEKPGSSRQRDEDEGSVDDILNDPEVRDEMRRQNLSEKEAREWVKASLTANKRGWNR